VNRMASVLQMDRESIYFQAMKYGAQELDSLGSESVDHQFSQMPGGRENRKYSSIASSTPVAAYRPYNYNWFH
jgi:hypothetical protein